MIRPILWKLWGTALIWIAWKSLRSSREFPWICDMIGWTLHEVKQCLFLQQSIDWKNLTTAALHYVGHVCDVVWAVSGNLHFDAPCAHTNSSIQLSSKYPLNPFEPVLLTSKYLSEGWTGTWTPPQKKKKELHQDGIMHGILLRKTEIRLFFPDLFQQRFQKTRCHADCYSSSSWLKQIAPVGRSNHRVTHGTLVHYDLGIRGIRVKHPWVKLMGDVFWCQKGPHDSLGMWFKR